MRMGEELAHRHGGGGGGTNEFVIVDLFGGQNVLHEEHLGGFESFGEFGELCHSFLFICDEFNSISLCCPSIERIHFSIKPYS